MKSLYEKIKENVVGTIPLLFCAVPGAVLASILIYEVEKHPDWKYESRIIKNLEATAIYVDQETFRVINKDIDGNGKYETILMFEDTPIAQIEKGEEGSLLINSLL